MSLSAYIDSAGVHAPTYTQILASLQASYQAIFGPDVYLGNDSQDGQLLAVFAQAISDANSAAIQIYNAFSPATAQGTNLDSNIKINGIKRLVATYGTVQLTLVGQAGTTITNGIAQDVTGNNWLLPASVTIPSSGTVVALATAQNPGAINASVGAITKIMTPQVGWQSVTNATAATPGSPVETDAALRQRQAASVSLPAQTPLAAVVGQVAAVSGVTRYMGYENPSSAVDANGAPANSIYLVVEGGGAASIAQAIANSKTIGAPTYGTTSQTVTAYTGMPETINFFVVQDVQIYVAISLHAISGYTSAIGTEIQNAISAYINALAIGQPVRLSRLYTPANLSGGTDSLTYEIMSLQIGLSAGTVGTADLAIAFNQAAYCAPANITITQV